jgi:membrane protease YdiL (CAAX protease family)
MNVNESVRRAPVLWLQWMPNWLEFGVVFGLTLWPFVYYSAAALLTAVSGEPMAQTHLGSLLILEAYALALVAPLLYGRGWTLESLGLRLDSRDCLSGVALAVMAYAGYVALWLLFASMAPDIARDSSQVTLSHSQMGAATLLAAAIAMGFFEELFVVGYLMQSVRARFGIVTAVNISIAVRILFHLYQGPISVVGMIPIGLIFAWAYVRTGRLWPLIVGHALLDGTAIVQLLD